MNLSNGRNTVFFMIIVISTFSIIYDYSACPAFAGGDDIACAIYAKTAVLQQEQNIKQKCGFTGPEWNSDYNYHLKWCLGINAPSEAGTAFRVKMLMQCKGVQFPVGADKWCNIYSILAIGQNVANISSQCGLDGPEWNSDYGYHYRWCVKAPKNNSVAGMNLRRDALKKCSK